MYKRQEERTAHGSAESAPRPAYPVENGFKADLNRRITDIERQMREEAKLSAEERQRRHEEEMQPRPFDGLLEPHLKEGSFVRVNTAGVRYQVGYLKDVTRYGATFHPLDLGKEQREKIAAYISVRDAYERLYTYEAEYHDEGSAQRKALNARYDEFVARYGNLNAKANVKLLMMDASGRDILAICLLYTSPSPRD